MIVLSPRPRDIYAERMTLARAQLCRSAEHAYRNRVPPVGNHYISHRARDTGSR